MENNIHSKLDNGFALSGGEPSLSILLLQNTIGASISLLATAIVDIPNQHDVYIPGWYAVWFIIQLATITPPVVLTLGSVWRNLPFHLRINTIFGYFVVGWITLLAVGVKLASGSAISLLELAFFLTGIGVVIGILYWLLRRGYLDSPESLFP